MNHAYRLAAALAIGFWGGSVAAQEPASSDPGAGESAVELDPIKVQGSHRIERLSDARSIVPVDVIPMDKPVTQGAYFDLAQTLQYIAPSFNSTRQTGADNADLVDSAALRGLGSDQTLVLVNGKRRHSVALVNLFGARNRGNTGTDLNAIPLLAVGQVDVLRDGAAAQYGSDAIAGVMNISLKRQRGCQGLAGFGQYSRGDGEQYLGSAYCGIRMGEGGLLALTGEYLDRGRSDRSDEGNPRIIGDSRVQNGTLYVNGDAPLSDLAAAYFTLGYQQRDASSAAFARGGVGSGDIPSRNSAAMYPDGFVPFINGDIEDRYGTVGARSALGEWQADLSTTYGYNDLHNTISNTLNASIANQDLMSGGAGISPTQFDAGGFSFTQSTTNLDFSRPYAGVLGGLKLALGAEYRRERYQIFAGEPGSYIDADGAGDGAAGSQGFPGFQPRDATDQDRDSYAAYVDTETEVLRDWTVGVAGRYENYSDFGSTTTGKLATGLRMLDSLLLRGSVSTGFRAPSLQQKYFSSTFTDFVSGVPVDVLLAPSDGEIARAAGLPSLTEERSQSYTVGATLDVLGGFAVTLDLYQIDIDDRIVLTGRFDQTDPNIGATLAALGVGQAQFFVNSLDTRTQGVDLTVGHTAEVGGGRLGTFLAVNFNDTRVEAIHAPPALVGREDVLLSERERLFIEEGAPRRKATLGFDYTWARINPVFKIIHFGEQTLGTFSGPPVPNAYYGPKTSADASITYAFTPRWKFTVGGANLFDVFPDEQDPNETDNGHKYDSVQFGLNGASYFARLAATF